MTIRRVPVLSCALLLAAGCSRGGRETAESRAAAFVPVLATTSAGPAKVFDLRVAAAAVGSSPHAFVVSGGRAFFTADDGSSGFELWVTNGRADGTSRVADLRPGGPSSLPAAGRFAAIPFTDPLPPQGQGILFAADDGARGQELWFSDGTASGTRLVADVAAGSTASAPRLFAAVGANVFFVADTSTGTELWVTDGTQAVRAIAGSVLAPPRDLTSLVAVGQVLYLTAANGADLWRIDASGAPPFALARLTKLKNFGFGGVTTPLIAFPVAGQDRVLFGARAAFGVDPTLWMTDGTVGGTASLGASPLDPGSLTRAGSVLYFAASSTDLAGRRRDLWALDGAAAPPTLTRKTAQDLSPTLLTASGSNLFLSGHGPAFGREPCVWNGASLVVLDLVTGPGDSSPASFTDFGGGVVLFGAQAPVGLAGSTGVSVASLFRSDGTLAGTRTVKDTGGPEVAEIAMVGGAAVLSGGDNLSGFELWRSDATEPNTTQIVNIRPDLPGSAPDALRAWNGRLWFSADDGLNGRELWTADPAAGAAVLFADVNPFASDSVPDDFVDLGGTLLFTASGSSQAQGVLVGRELWSTDGATVNLVRDIRPGALPSVVRPAWLTRVPGTATAVFAADPGDGSGRELWVTDGAELATTLVVDLWPGAGASSLPSGLTAAGGRVFFTADDPDSTPDTPNPHVYRTDGTAAGTARADTLCPCTGPACADRVYDPAWFADLNGTTLFSAVNSTLFYGRELYRYDAGSGCVTLVADLVSGLPPDDSSNPVAFAALGPFGYFGAKDDQGLGYALYRTDGFPTGTVRLASVGTKGLGSISSTVAVGDQLFFVGDDEVNGPELWGAAFTPSGVVSVAPHLVMDVSPGPLGGLDGSQLLALPARGRVVFAANDGLTGRELWISDGSALGTRLLQDLRAGAESSNPDGLLLVGDHLYFTADDGMAGRELWVIDTSPAGLDLTPPTIDCPAVLQAELTSPTGADPVFALSASDAGGPVTLSYAPAPGTHFHAGLTTVLATAWDPSGNAAQCTFQLNVVDTVPPDPVCPGTVRAEATSPAGGPATFLATATDAVGLATITYVPASGSIFPLGPGHAPGTTGVVATALDLAGNTSTCSFSVVVSDTTPPAMTCPVPPIGEALSPAGGFDPWGDATAVDLVSGAVAVLYDHGPGDFFPLGVSTVIASAHDDQGNVGTCDITIRIADARPPAISCPVLDPVEATTFNGSHVSFDALAVDSVDPSPLLAYAPARGALFVLGQTTVTASATDFSGNQGVCTFDVLVRDTLAPTITCPASVVAEAQDATGASVTFEASAVDTATPTANLSLSYDHGPGSAFPLGPPTTVTATARDDSGNASTCQFQVSVLDRIAPTVVACQPEVFFEVTSPAGAVVSFPRTFAHDVPTVTADPDLAYTFVPSDGQLHAMGSFAVTGRAADHSGNLSAPCTFTATVRDTTPPAVTCPTVASPISAGAPTGARVEWAPPTATDLGWATLPAPALSAMLPGNLFLASVSSGETYPVGTTTVFVNVTDGSSNVGQCQFDFTVADLTPPAILCPADRVLEATSPQGAVATFDATATDSVAPLFPVPTYAPDRGSTFPLGDTIVTATAADAAGNTASCQFNVRVQDTLPPVIACPATTLVEATSAAGAAVSFDASVSDSGSGVQSIVRVPDLATFPLGDTPELITATDLALNVSTCATTVRVQDTTPPTLSCPASVDLVSDGPAAVSFAMATASDLVTPDLVVTSSVQSGSVFQLGTTGVVFSATDGAGNTGRCTMSVTVHAPEDAKKGGCGCGASGAGTTGLLGLLATALRRRRRLP